MFNDYLQIIEWGGYDSVGGLSVSVKLVPKEIQ